MLSVIAIDEVIVTKMLVALQKCGNALAGGSGTVHGCGTVHWWVAAAVQISLSLVISADSPRYFIIARTTATIINIPNYFSYKALSDRDKHKIKIRSSQC